jgi:uncharacterized protein YcaQ
VARVDLKSDRAAGVLRVQSAFAEADVGSADGPAVDEVSVELAESSMRRHGGWAWAGSK